MEAPDLSDFVPILGYSRYLINKIGDIWIIDRCYIKKTGMHTNGYPFHNLVGDDGRLRGFRKHRLVCMVFKPHVNQDSLQVNHLNGIKADCHVDNLEWVTPKENVEHAGRLGLSPKCIPVTVRELDTGDILQFPSILVCSEYYGVPKDNINYRINNPHGSMRVFPERRQYRKTFGNDLAEWYTPPDLDRAIRAFGNKTCVMLRNVHTGEDTEFYSMTEVATFLGIPLQTVNTRLSRGSNTVYPGGYLIKRSYDKTPWPSVTKEYGTTRGVIATNAKTNERIEYTSCTDCARQQGVKLTALVWRLSNGVPGRVYPDGFSYQYKSQSA